MEGNRRNAKMPELFVFVKAMFLGFILAEIFRITSIGGNGLADLVANFDPRLRLAIVAITSAILFTYTLLRDVWSDLKRLIQSWRFDLLILVMLGIFSNDVFLSSTQQFHEHISKSNPLWTLLLACFLFIMISSSIVRALLSLKKKPSIQLYFLADDEIQDENHDVLGHKEQAGKFAQTVFASGSSSGLVYGIDGPWGTGKTSFVNLASSYWLKATNEVIVFRFEPLRYASDPDLAEKFIRDLSTEIQRQVFVPEFQPAANRYSRMLKGKTDFSLLGFKLTLEPTVETVDELLDDIDDVLMRIGRRLIVVIDDLDRLDTKAINNVLFTVQRTFKLTQAAYILCYDTENLVGGKEDSERARQFLEKFVNIKLSLFVDSSFIIRFLRREWNKEEEKFPSIPSETMLKLEALLNELANILEDKKIAAKYLTLIGDMRKLKRFVNALLLMQFEKTNFAHTDFNLRDLINLTLLHLNYPGIFRFIYVEETAGRSGIFSIKSKNDSGTREFINAEDYAKYVESYLGVDRFLLDQLFSVKSLEFSSPESIDESIMATRACFNAVSNRNLENYLELIVRFVTPARRDTFRLYQDAVSRVIDGATIAEVLSDSEFDLKYGEQAHDQFWRILVSQARKFTDISAEDSIATLIKNLPKYSSVDMKDRGLRSGSIYNLIKLLDRAGWGRTSSKSLPNKPENIVEIAYRIYGEKEYKGQGLIDQLADDARGVLGLYDLMLFRLLCSADRQGQIFNLHSALILYDDMAASTTGFVSDRALAGMRTISQRIFALFKARYIDRKQNLFDDVDAIADAEFLGAQAELHSLGAEKNRTDKELRDSIEGTRSMTKLFIVYQLTNQQPATGAGVGTGYYDTEGINDRGEIASLMNDYLFDFCFDPTIKPENINHFLDYCLCNLTRGNSAGNDEEGYRPTQRGLASELNDNKLIQYWETHGETIKAGNFISLDKRVVTLNYSATYKEDLPRVFDVLDQIQSNA